MSASGRIAFEVVAWFNGSLLDDGSAPLLGRDEIETALTRASANWQSYKRNLQRSYPKQNERVLLNIED